MKRCFLVLSVLMLGFALGWLVRGAIRPDYPAHWDNLILGMTEKQAHEAVSLLDSSFREVKGFDQTGIDYGDRYWNLVITYDAAGRVDLIMKKYIDRRWGLFNKSISQSSRSDKNKSAE